MAREIKYECRTYFMRTGKKSVMDYYNFYSIITYFYCRWLSILLWNRNGADISLHSREVLMHGYPLAMVAYGIGVLPWSNKWKWNLLSSANCGMLILPVQSVSSQTSSYIFVCYNNFARVVVTTLNPKKTFWFCTWIILKMENGLDCVTVLWWELTRITLEVLSGTMIPNVIW